MSTRGVVGFRIDGRDKVTYNHSDSYPAGLGNGVLKFLRAASEADIRARARSLKVVTEDVPPTDAEYQQLAAIRVDTANHGDNEQWYWLLHETQGDLEAILKCGFIVDWEAYLQQSLYCEWAYIVNLDTRKLEVYRGFQDKPHTKGRFVDVVKEITADLEGRDQYYPVALVGEHSFDELPESLHQLYDNDDD